MVALDLGRNFWTLSAVSSGHVAKWPALMALIHVDVVGLKQAAWRNWISSVVLVEVIAALAVGLWLGVVVAVPVGPLVIGVVVWFLEVQIPEAVSVAFSLKNLLAAFVYDDGLFGEGCYATVITKYTY